jgi:hypothetical protein
VDTANIVDITTELAAFVAKHQSIKGKQRKRPVSPPKTALLKVRMTEAELDKLQNFAIAKNCTASQIIREYIHRLPNAKKVAEQKD